MIPGTLVRVTRIDTEDTDDGVDVGDLGSVTEHACDDIADGLIYVRFGAMSKFMWADQLEATE